MIKLSWTDNQRRLIWFLLSKSRVPLSISLDPIVATAFVLLQNLFVKGNMGQYHLFIVTASSLVASCKVCRSPRPIQTILSILARLCDSNLFPILKELLVDLEIDSNCNISTNVYREICKIEIEIFSANNYSDEFDLPFRYLSNFNQILFDKKELEIKILQDVCLLICSQGYLEIGPEITAAAAVFGTLVGEIGTDDALLYASSMTDKFGKEKLDKALQFMCFERNRTMNAVRVRNKHEQH